MKILTLNKQERQCEKWGIKKEASIRNELGAGKTVGVVETVAERGMPFIG